MVGRPIMTADRNRANPGRAGLTGNRRVKGAGLFRQALQALALTSGGDAP
jgi:hypothetical protein